MKVQKEFQEQFSASSINFPQSIKIAAASGHTAAPFIMSEALDGLNSLLLVKPTLSKEGYLFLNKNINWLWTVCLITLTWRSYQKSLMWLDIYPHQKSDLGWVGWEVMCKVVWVKVCVIDWERLCERLGEEFRKRLVRFWIQTCFIRVSQNFPGGT